MFAQFCNVKKNFGIDIGIGDIVTPYPILYSYKSSFFDGDCSLRAYTKETIIAEKFETLVSKGTNNSRSKDLIDLYLLSEFKMDDSILSAAIINTFFFRNTIFSRAYIASVLNDVFSFQRTKELFMNYCLNHKFASNISFDQCATSALTIASKIHYIDFHFDKKLNIEIDLVRHGEDEQDKLGGWSANHLTEYGVKQVRGLKEILDVDYDLVISSDLIRAKETTEILNEKLKSNIIYTKDFREMNNGDLVGLTQEEAKTKYSGIHLTSLKMNQKYPNGESPNDFYARIKNVFVKLLDNNNKKILLVTHGGVITVILSLLYGFEYSNLLKIYPKTGTLTKVIIKDGCFDGINGRFISK